ncbi:MAG: hypothetical protein EOO45_11865 [Flavobacterium sp.]|nr:MAG: hypothetical protein EOO45_11865 [Flavobacterium sp.]
MANKLLFLFLIFLPCVVLAQKEQREILRGRVVADSLQVENISVLNVSSNIGAVTDERGNFTIYARPADTLQFTSITFRSGRIVLKKSDFLEEKFMVRLEENVTVLDEIRIIPLTGDLSRDSKKAKTLLVTSGINSGAIAKDYYRNYKNDENINSVWHADGSAPSGIDFVRVFKSFFKKKKSDKPERDAYNRRLPFAEVAKEKFTYHFFTETLKIPKDEIGLFLTFCDNGAFAASLTDPAKEFELTDYLITKSAEYLKKSK